MDRNWGIISPLPSLSLGLSKDAVAQPTCPSYVREVYTLGQCWSFFSESWEGILAYDHQGFGFPNNPWRKYELGNRSGFLNLICILNSV